MSTPHRAFESFRMNILQFRSFKLVGETEDERQKSYNKASKTGNQERMAPCY